MTASNYPHTTAGRAHQSGGYVYANGSDDAMGLWNVFTTHTLKQTGPDYWVLADGRIIRLPPRPADPDPSSSPVLRPSARRCRRGYLTATTSGLRTRRNACEVFSISSGSRTSRATSLSPAWLNSSATRSGGNR